MGILDFDSTYSRDGLPLIEPQTLHKYFDKFNALLDDRSVKDGDKINAELRKVRAVDNNAGQYIFHVVHRLPPQHAADSALAMIAMYQLYEMQSIHSNELEGKLVTSVGGYATNGLALVTDETYQKFAGEFDVKLRENSLRGGQINTHLEHTHLSDPVLHAFESAMLRRANSEQTQIEVGLCMVEMYGILSYQAQHSNQSPTGLN